MSKELKLNSTYLYDIANRSSYYYKDYSIPKKKGGHRNISQPSPELKTLQYWIKDNILTKMPISKFAFAYNKGDSIKKHASIHSKSRFLFHSDIMAFFPSIHFAILKKEFEHNRELFNKLNKNTTRLFVWKCFFYITLVNYCRENSILKIFCIQRRWLL